MRKPSLREIQERCCEAVYAGDRSLAPWVRRGAGPRGQDRLAIYQSSVFGILTRALSEIYPVVRRLVGARFFDQLARVYIPGHPSVSGDLHRYGGEFPAFIESFQGTAKLIYLADVARLEWCYHQVFHGAEHPPLSLATLANVPPEWHPALRFKLHPAARLLASSFPVHQIWAVNQPGWEAETVDLEAGDEARLLIARRDDFQIEIEPLSQAGFAFLQMLADEAGLESACEVALGLEPGFDTGHFLRRHIGLGTLVDFR